MTNVTRSAAQKTRWDKQNRNKIRIYLYISYAEKLKTENDAEKMTPWIDMSIQGVIDALHADVDALLQDAAGRRRREWTAAFQWRWPHLERHAACIMQASCRSHFQNADCIFPNAACMSLVLRPYAACIRQYAGCSRMQQSACILHEACMQGACISSVNPALQVMCPYIIGRYYNNGRVFTQAKQNKQT